MSTRAIYTNLKLNKKQTENYHKIMQEESPCKDIKPIPLKDIQKKEEQLSQWLKESTN